MQQPRHTAAKTSHILLAFLAVYVVWGSTYLAIRYGIETLPPLLMAGTRFVLAGTLLYVVSRVCGAERPRAIHWRSAAIIGGLMLLVGNGLVTLAERVVPSGVAALIVASVPLFVVLLEGRRPAARVVGGLLLGFTGIALLVGPGRIGGEPVNPWGAAALVLASLAWAAGSLYSRRAPQPASGIQFTGMEMMAGGALLLVVGLARGESQGFALAAVSARSFAAFLYLIACGSLVGFTAYVWLLKVVSPSRAATYAYVNPVVAVLLGFVFAGEPLGARVLVAMTVIVAAVALIVSAPPPRSAAPAGAVPRRAAE